MSDFQSIRELAKCLQHGGVGAERFIVSWDQPLTEAQCLEKAESAITGASSGLTTFTAAHAWVGTKNSWGG